MTLKHSILVALLLGTPIGTVAQTHGGHGGHGGDPAAPLDERPFLAETGAAMDRMMDDMAVPPTGDVDADFAAMMIPHHQGAIDMAVAYLRVGQNPRLRRLAQEIVVEQQQEIAAMRLAIGAPLPLPSAAATPVAPAAPAQ